MGLATRPIIFDYFNYIDFLNDYFSFEKSLNPSYSQREFLRKADISGSAVLHRVITGGKKLNKKYIPNFCTALGLKKKESFYFEALIAYGNANTLENKNEHLKTIFRIRASIPEYRIIDKKLNFFRQWYYPVVREIVSLVDCRDDYNLISRMVVPPITSVQAKNAIKFLLKNGFIKKEKSGRYLLTEPFISTGDPIKSTLLARYHQKNLGINQKAVDLVPKELISNSSLTLSVSEKTFHRFRQEIQDFRARLMAITKEDPNPERVFHVGFTMLPRSRKKGSKYEK